MPLLLSATKENKQKSTGQALFWTLHCPHVSAHSCIYLCQDTGPPLLPAGRSPQLLSSQLRLLSCSVHYAHPLQPRDIDSVTVLPPCSLSNELSFFCVCLWVETHDFTERVWDLEDSLGCRSPPATLFAAGVSLLSVARLPTPGCPDLELPGSSHLCLPEAHWDYRCRRYSTV